MFPDRSIRTFSGAIVDPLKLLAEEIALIDIAHALANKCRFSGHTRVFYSVAQHCVLAAEQAPAEHRLAMLLHDADECYLPDVVTPLKHLYPGHHEASEHILRTVSGVFGFVYPFDGVVKTIDRLMLATEGRDLCGWGRAEFECSSCGAEPLPLRIEPWTWSEARAEFLEAFSRITGDG